MAANSGAGLFRVSPFHFDWSNPLPKPTEFPNGIALQAAAANRSHPAAFVAGAGVPTDGVTGATITGVGSVYVDTTNANLYVNAGTSASPVWKLVTRAA